MDGTDKNTRILKLYDDLINGKIVNKMSFSVNCNISERTFDRDIQDIRLFLSENFSSTELLFDKSKNGYCFSDKNEYELSDSEMLPLLNIIRSSKERHSEKVNEVAKILFLLIEKKIGRRSIKKIKDLIENEMQL